MTGAGRATKPIVEALSRLVVAEGHRLLAESARSADPARLAAGWERRFIADSRRAEEAAALYRALGFEVEFDDLAAVDLPADCTDCQLAELLSFRTVYTRKPAGGEP